MRRGPGCALAFALLVSAPAAGQVADERQRIVAKILEVEEPPLPGFDEFSIIVATRLADTLLIGRDYFCAENPMAAMFVARTPEEVAEHALPRPSAAATAACKPVQAAAFRFLLDYLETGAGIAPADVRRTHVLQDCVGVIFPAYLGFAPDELKDLPPTSFTATPNLRLIEHCVRDINETLRPD